MFSRGGGLFFRFRFESFSIVPLMVFPPFTTVIGTASLNSDHNSDDGLVGPSQGMRLATA